MNLDSITGKTVWLTGASSGIGFELAQLLIKANNFVIVSARSKDRLQSLKLSNGERVTMLPLDVTSDESVRLARQLLNEVTDHLDLVICCAGTCEYDDGPDLNADMYSRVMNTNFLGTVQTLNMALPLLKKSESRAHIVGVSSLTTEAPFPRAQAYGASKAALEYFLESLKVDLDSEGIDVSIVRPGFVDTPLTQKNDFSMPFLMGTAKAAELMLQGIKKRKTYINFPKRMCYMLRLLNFSSWFWFKTIAPKLRRSDSL